jgi:transposase
MRTKGTAAELEVRRRIAARLFTEDFTLADVARCVGASVSSVGRWKRAWKQGGAAALAAKPRPVPRCRLSDEQKSQLVAILLRGPLAAGYVTDLWTCARVAQVIHQQFGVTYHADHVGRLLHGLGFTPQKPQRKARERDEQAIERWRRVEWPRIKKREHDEKLASCSSTKRAFCCNR